MNYEMYEYQGDWYYKAPAISKYAGLACANECEFIAKDSDCTFAKLSVGMPLCDSSGMVNKKLKPNQPSSSVWKNLKTWILKSTLNGAMLFVAVMMLLQT